MIAADFPPSSRLTGRSSSAQALATAESGEVLPIIVAQLVVLLKDTSLGYVVAYPEILRISHQLKDYFGSTQYSFSIFVVTLLIYLAVNFSLSALARGIARRSGPKAGVASEQE